MRKHGLCQGEMADVLERLEARSEELGITDIQLSLTSLEEVFLTIARKVWTPLQLSKVIFWR